MDAYTVLEEDKTKVIVRPVDASVSREIRMALERAAVKIETRSGCKPYRDAWKIAAKIVRESKPD